MPFDSLPTESQGHARLRRLAAKLRREMPAGFHWNYRVVLFEERCGTAGCALGLELVTEPAFREFADDPVLAATASLSRFTYLVSVGTAAKWFGISDDDAIRIFFSRGSYACIDDVPPSEVADRIDALLARDEALVRVGGAFATEVTHAV